MLRWKRHRLCDAGHSVQLTLTRDTWLQATLTGSYNYGKRARSQENTNITAILTSCFTKGYAALGVTCIYGKSARDDYKYD